MSNPDGATAPGPDSGPTARPDGGAGGCYDGVFLDVTQAPGAGAAYPAPQLTVTCTDDTLTVQSNTIPHYTFVPITPNPLRAVNNSWSIPRNPQRAAQPTTIPLLGDVGFAVNGVPFFGPNEAGQPTAQMFGDPIFNDIMDECLGHTAMEYHYHALVEKCLTIAGLVAEPWLGPDPAANEPSPILGFALDGFPIYGSRGCVDATCSQVVEHKSSYDRVGDPTTNAWDAYQYNAKNSPEFLDRCNGHEGPDGDYHYHATSDFPYIIGCYTGTPAARGGGGGGGCGGGGMMPPNPDGGTPMMGPRPCTSDADCVGACPPGSQGCTCNQSPIGQICVPTCMTDADCPMTPRGQLRCDQNRGICRL